MEHRKERDTKRRDGAVFSHTACYVKGVRGQTLDCLQPELTKQNALNFDRNLQRGGSAVCEEPRRGV